jgi:hypothetical protein
MDKAKSIKGSFEPSFGKRKAIAFELDPLRSTIALK